MHILRMGNDLNSGSFMQQEPGMKTLCPIYAVLRHIQDISFSRQLRGHCDPFFKRFDLNFNHL